MNYMLLKLPIYFIIWHKVLQISKVRSKLKESDGLRPDDETKLTAFMMMYGCVFLLLLLS
jgi:hypothetical protein